jgi:hypothetical protein
VDDGDAFAQGAAAGRALIGRPEMHAPLPCASSEQFGRRLQVVGLVRGDEQVVLRGDAVSPAQLADEGAALAAAVTPVTALAGRSLPSLRLYCSRERTGLSAFSPSPATCRRRG